jgi:hypothetical protein
MNLTILFCLKPGLACQRRIDVRHIGLHAWIATHALHRVIRIGLPRTRVLK